MVKWARRASSAAMEAAGTGTLVRRSWCGIVGHDDEVRARWASAFLWRTYSRCRRCGRQRERSGYTVAGVDREAREILLPPIRAGLYAENPLFAHLTRAGDKPASP